MGGFEYIVERGFACGGGNCSTGSWISRSCAWTFSAWFRHSDKLVDSQLQGCGWPSLWSS